MRLSNKSAAGFGQVGQSMLAKDQFHEPPMRLPVLLDRDSVEFIFNKQIPFRPTFNARLFTMLKQERNNLDEDYFAILEILQKKKNFHLRPRFIQFKGVLERYMARTAVELYSYLRVIYAHDPAMEQLIAKHEKSTYSAVTTVAKFLNRYSSPSTVYSEQFEREIRTIWVLLKLRYKEENAMIYPLYRPV